VKKKKNKIILISCLVVPGLFVLGGIVSHSVKNTKGEEKLKVRTETVTRGRLVETINAPGQIEPRTKVDISAKLSARVVELPFREGERVKAGDVVVRLDSKDMESRLHSAQASRDAQAAQIEVEKARILGQKATLVGTQAKLAQLRADFERQKQLLASQDISQSAFDAAKAALEELEAQAAAAEQSIQASELNLKVMEHNLTAAQAHVEEAKEALSYTTITSPMDGVVTRINAEVGEVVMTGTMNNPGTVILQVADLSKMILSAQVDESYIGQVKVGQPADVHVQAFWEDVFEGTVESIALTHDMSTAGTKYYKTEILMRGDVSKLYSGLTADVDIRTNVYEGVIMVPSQAVLERKTEELPEAIRRDNPRVDLKKTYLTVVYRVIDGKTVVTPVRIGASDLTHTVITEGLTEGDVVIVGPYKVLETIEHDKPAEIEGAQQEKTGEPNEPTSAAEGVL
jgi:HlyD family secretion protein